MYSFIFRHKVSLPLCQLLIVALFLIYVDQLIPTILSTQPPLITILSPQPTPIFILLTQPYRQNRWICSSNDNPRWKSRQATKSKIVESACFQAISTLYFSTLDINTTLSTCGVLGNISNGITIFTSYKSLNSFKFFPSVAGLQEMYTICFG